MTIAATTTASQISDPASVTKATATTGSSADQNALASAQNKFLNLLVTQLKNQNPLQPVDSNQFTQQLVQFSIAEQEVQQTKSLQDLASLQKRSTIGAAPSWLGANIEAPTREITLSAGRAECSYTLPADLKETTVTIRDSRGMTVAEKKAETSAGVHQFVWDGRGKDGRLAADGAYTVEIVGKDKSGATMDISPKVSGLVTGVSFEGGDLALMIGDIAVPLDQVQKISRNTANVSQNKE